MLFPYDNFVIYNQMEKKREVEGGKRKCERKRKKVEDKKKEERNANGRKKIDPRI